jgi:hypothetical protein
VKNFGCELEDMAVIVANAASAKEIPVMQGQQSRLRLRGLLLAQHARPERKKRRTGVLAVSVELVQDFFDAICEFETIEAVHFGAMHPFTKQRQVARRYRATARTGAVVGVNT